MDTSNITSLIYQAVYITIFIVASAITINLFTTINDYSEIVDKNVKADSISEVVSENEDNAQYVEDLTHEYKGYEVYSLANNYGFGYYDEKIKAYSYNYGAKFNNEIALDYFITIKDKDGNDITDIEKINLTATYEISFENKKNVVVYRKRNNQNVANKKTESYKEMILTEKKGD